MSTHLRHDDRFNVNIMTTTTAAHPDGASKTDAERHAPICPTDGDAIVPAKKLDKKSAEYLVKSGLAGGFAGCAVRIYHCLYPCQTMDAAATVFMKYFLLSLY